MKASIQHSGKTYEIDLSQPIDISIPVRRAHSPNAFYLGAPQYKTVEAGSFVGNVRRGGSCNCEDIVFNPHGNGTHTECAGHISAEPILITQALEHSFFPAILISVRPASTGSGEAIDKSTLSQVFPANENRAEALIIRTLPNPEAKKEKNYSGTNPAYITAEAVEYITSLGIQHILTDLPSLDKEDDGQLLAHHAFFQDGEGWHTKRTATELIYVPDNIPDGMYWLDLQVAGFEADAAPSKPLLYAIRHA